MGLTLNSLPHEVVLSIVEWTAQLTLEEQLEQERLEHERAHQHHMGHNHGPMPFHNAPHGPLGLGDGLGPMPGGQAGGINDGQGQDNAGIGGMDFVQNLFGFLTGGAVPQGPATPGTGNADDEETDDEMPPLEALVPHAPPGQANSHTTGSTANVTPGNGSASDAGDGMPDLEPVEGVPHGPSNDSNPDSYASDPDMPELEELSSGDEHNVPTAAAATETPIPSTSPATASLPLSVDPYSFDAPVSEAQTAISTPNGHDDGTPTPGISPTNVSTAASNVEAPMPFSLQLDGSLAHDMMGELSPAALSTASINGTLAHELENMQESTSTFTSQDLAEMPDLDAPMQTTVDEEEEDGSDWSTEEEDMASDEDEDEDEDEEAEMHDALEGEDTLMDPELPLPSTNGPVKSAEPSELQVTYEDGLPSCPYLPLAFINRSFLNATRTLLYGRHVHLMDAYQAHLFLRTLTSPHVSIHLDEEPDADDEDARRQQSLSYLVRDLTFDIRNLISLGRGGASILIDLIKLCTRLERLSYTSDLMKSAQKPLEAALAGCISLRAIALRGGDLPAKDLMWDMRRLAAMLGKWPQLRDLQVLWLKSSLNGPLIPAPKIHLTKLSLAHPDITDSDLSYLLRYSKATLKQLEIHRPTAKLTRLGVANALVDYGKTITSLQVDVQAIWHPISQMAPPAEGASIPAEKAAKSRYMVDGLIGHLPNLSELKLSGSLVSTVLLARLPKSLTVLALEDNMGVDVRKAITLFKKKRTVRNGNSSKTVPVVAPKLRCFTLSRSDGAMLSETIMREFEKLFDQRKACVHWAYHSPSAVWRPDGDPPANPLEMMGNLLGMQPPPPFDVDAFGFEGLVPMPMMQPMFGA